MRARASASRPSPVSSTATRTSPAKRLDTDRNRSVAGGVSKRVGEQVHEHALDLLGRETRGELFVDIAGESDMALTRVCLHASKAARDHGSDGKLSELERQRLGVDARELEEVVDELREDSDLLA